MQLNAPAIEFGLVQPLLAWVLVVQQCANGRRWALGRVQFVFAGTNRD
jgi:hypothetical protein